MNIRTPNCYVCGKQLVKWVKEMEVGEKDRWTAIDVSGHTHEDVCSGSGKNKIIRFNKDICEHHK